MTPPQSIAVDMRDVYSTEAVDDVQLQTEIRLLRRSTWVHNPFYINDIDWGHMLSLAVIALKALVHPQDIWLDRATIRFRFFSGLFGQRA
jgi:hypothetical protein